MPARPLGRLPFQPDPRLVDGRPVPGVKVGVESQVRRPVPGRRRLALFPGASRGRGAIASIHAGAGDLGGRIWSSVADAFRSGSERGGVGARLSSTKGPAGPGGSAIVRSRRRGCGRAGHGLASPGYGDGHSRRASIRARDEPSSRGSTWSGCLAAPRILAWRGCRDLPGLGRFLLRLRPLCWPPPLVPP